MFRIPRATYVVYVDQKLCGLFLRETAYDFRSAELPIPAEAMGGFIQAGRVVDNERHPVGQFLEETVVRKLFPGRRSRVSFSPSGRVYIL